MIRKERVISRGEKLEGGSSVTSTPRRDKKHHNAAYLRYQASARGAQGIEQTKQEGARGAQGIEQTKQVNVQDAQGTKRVEQSRNLSCI